MQVIGEETMSAEPSYLRKADWAEQHLMKLSKRVLAFMASEPYEVTDPIEGRRGRRTARLVFTGQPDPDIALIAGDVLYNLRTAFDYLVGSLVLPSERSKVLCPLVHEPVWDIPHTEGESTELTRNREKWESLTRRIKSDEAVEILKGLMPLDVRTPPSTMHPLDLLNRLSNRDRHRQLSVIAWGLGDARAKVVMKRSGEIRPAQFPDFDFTYRGFRDGADIPIDKNVAYVKLRGTPVVVMQVNEQWGNVLLPSGLMTILEWLRNEAIGKLARYSLPA
jgi:hypothetical protein